MPLETNNYFKPVEPKKYIGQQEIIKSFNELINKFKVGETEKRSVLIIGNNGTGKSSLLLKLAEYISGRRDTKTIYDIKPIKEQVEGFFRNWLNDIDKLTPNWGGIFEKIPELPLLKDENRITDEKEYVQKFTNKFFEKMDKIDKKLKNEKIRLYFFIDNTSIFRMMRYSIFYKIFSQIVEEITKKGYNLFVVTTIDELFLSEIDIEKKLTFNSDIYKLKPLTEAEAQIFIKEKSPELKLSDVLELLENSERTYFDLILAIFFIEKKLSVTDYVEKNIVKLLDISEEEHEALQEMGTYSENLFPEERLLKFIQKETLDSLEKKGLIEHFEDYIRFTQNALLDVVKFNEKLYSTLTIIMIKLDKILHDLESDIIPTDIEFQELRKITSRIHDGLSYNVVGAKVNQIIKMLIKKKEFQKAYDFALLNINNFDQLHDFVRAATIAEKVGRDLEEKHYAFAGKLYYRAGTFYETMKEDSKAKRAFIRAADQFEKQFSSLDAKTSPYLLRAHIKSCLDCYRKAKDEARFRRIKEKAIKIFHEESIHHRYVSEINYKKTEAIQATPIIEETKEEEKKPIDIDDLEKELEF
ncbi:MAG: hypothetical protein ACTSVB_11900 [Candidatus Heimdallarchaeaceae archaeon]